MTAGERPSPSRARWAWLGRVPFDRTAALQEQVREAVLEQGQPETILLCEHDPVITLGRRARREHLLVREDALARMGVAVARASRGGDVTYHGPGQLVGYPILRLRRGVLAHVEGMARAIAEVLASRGVAAEWRRACPGLWVGDHKICAFGVHVRRGVAIHGFALNLTTDLRAFEAIVPCGLRDTGVTSLARLSADAPTPAALASEVAAALGRALGLELERELDVERGRDGWGAGAEAEPAPPVERAGCLPRCQLASALARMDVA